MNKEFNGLILLDKPSGMTSHDVVAKARRILKTKSVGHSGTLDPMASGLLILLIGEATKLNPYIVEGEKAYQVGLQLGIKTDTLDITGTILSTDPVNKTSAEVVNAALQFVGEMNIPVPIYSAIKVDGKKLYEYAREAVAVEVPMKIMKFWDVEFLHKKSESYIFNLRCSKGSYIRSWVDELGKSLGTSAVMSSLKRSFSKPYSIEQAINLEKLELEYNSGVLSSAWIPLHNALPNLKKLYVRGFDLSLLLNGQISHDLRIKLIQVFEPDLDQFVQIFSADSKELLAIIGLEPGRGFIIKRVFKPLG